MLNGIFLYLLQYEIYICAEDAFFNKWKCRFIRKGYRSITKRSLFRFDDRADLQRLYVVLALIVINLEEFVSGH